MEDSNANVLVVSTWLEQLGCRYEIAYNGKEAIEKAQNRQFDIILMDVQMLDIDGLTATRIIRDNEARRRQARIPIIGITAYDMEKCLDAGMDDYIARPFTPIEFEDKIVSLLKLEEA